MKKKLTPNQEAYKKEIKRIRNFVKRASKRGFIFDSDIIPEMPSRVTQSKLKEIRKLKPELLYRRAKYIDVVSGEMYTGSQGRYLERYRASKGYTREQLSTLPRESEVILDNIRNLINQFIPRTNWSQYWIGKKTRDKDRLSMLLETTISTLGERQVALNIQGSSEDLEKITEYILYGSDEEQIEFNIVKIGEIIRGGGLNSEELAELTELQEQNETL